MTRILNEVREHLERKAAADLQSYLALGISETGYEGENHLKISSLLKQLTPMKDLGVPFEKSLRTIALIEIERELSTSSEAISHQILLRDSSGGRTLQEELRSIGVESVAASMSRPIDRFSLNEGKLRSAGQSFISVIRRLRDIADAKAGVLNVSVDSLIDRSSLLNTQVFEQRRLFKTSSVDWSQPPPIDQFEISLDEIQLIGRKFVENCGYGEDQVAMYFSQVPFWGLEFDLEVGSRAAVICGQSSGLRCLSALVHELGHAVDCVSWDRDFSCYLFRDPALKETSAAVTQRLIEMPEACSKFLGIDMARAETISALVVNNKLRELAYLFVLMDLDEHFWGEDAPTLESSAEVYASSCLRHFGFSPPSPFGFCVEQIHYLYPCYMTNYFLADLFSAAILPGAPSRDEFAQAMSRVRVVDFEDLISRVPELSQLRRAELSSFI